MHASSTWFSDLVSQDSAGFSSLQAQGEQPTPFWRDMGEASLAFDNCGDGRNVFFLLEDILGSE